MTVTADPPIEPGRTPDPVALDVRGLDAGAVLEEVVAHRRAAEWSEARVLMLAVHYVDLHPVSELHPAASPGAGDRLLVDRDPDTSDAPSLAGEGTPAVAEFAVEELGAVLGVPFGTAYALCADSVAVCHRLPRVWERLHAGLVPAWQARLVARETSGLSAEVVGFVDRQVAILVDRNRFPSLRVLRDLVHEARLRVDPDHERAVEERALAGRGVWFDHQTSTASAATTSMSAVLDAWDALDLDAALSGVAADLRCLGDTRDSDLRRAEALALLAHPQRVLDLGEAAAGTADADVSPDPDAPAARATDAGLAPRTRGSVLNLYVHTSLPDLARAGLLGTHPDPGAGAGASTGQGGCALVERLGPMLFDTLAGWLSRTERIVVRPVLDPTDPQSPATRPVDRHDPPPAMRDLVIVRDGQCVFPGCRIDARGCDLDHIDAYVDPDDGGPPGQTRPGNLACVCRRHHRLKTFTAWNYERGIDGSYTWISPRGQSFVTDPLPRRASAS